MNTTPRANSTAIAIIAVLFSLVGIGAAGLGLFPKIAAFAIVLVILAGLAASIMLIVCAVLRYKIWLPLAAVGINVLCFFVIVSLFAVRHSAERRTEFSGRSEDPKIGNSAKKAGTKYERLVLDVVKEGDRSVYQVFLATIKASGVEHECDKIVDKNRILNDMRVNAASIIWHTKDFRSIILVGQLQGLGDHFVLISDMGKQVGKISDSLSQ
ncbi:MAG: hypothetical protein WA151_16615, partial [Desulfatirhabdiaceae bacterium]